MKKRTGNLILLLFGVGVVFTLPAAAMAETGLFIEPAITYEHGNTSVKHPAPIAESSEKIEGYGLGARFGMHISEVIFLGLDSRYSTPQFTDAAVNYNAKAVSTNWGPILGMQMPIVGLRMWGSYVLGGELDPQEDNGFDMSYGGANGYRIGAGFNLVLLSVNLEYEQVKYNTATNERPGPFAPGTPFNNANLENKTWIVSVSFPLAM